MAKQIRVRVTQDHIDRATWNPPFSGKIDPHYGEHCPIGLALNDQYPLEGEGHWGEGNRQWWVTTIVASARDWPRAGEEFVLSKPAQKFVADYDHRGKAAVKPATFILTLMDPEAYDDDI